MSPHERSPAVALRGLVVGVAGGFELGPLDLDLPHGSVLLITGPNGSGKSTLLRTLACAQPPLAGHLVGLDRSSRVGWVVDAERDLPPSLTPSEIWSLVAHASSRAPDWSADSLSDRLGLTVRDRTVATLSHGQARKAALIAVLQQPMDVVLLDEPSNGLDAAAAQVLGDLLAERVSDGVSTVVVASHDPRLRVDGATTLDLSPRRGRVVSR